MTFLDHTMPENNPTYFRALSVAIIYTNREDAVECVNDAYLDACQAIPLTAFALEIYHYNAAVDYLTSLGIDAKRLMRLFVHGFSCLDEQ